MIKLDNGLSYRVNFGTDYYSGQEQMFYAKASTSQGFGNAKAEQKATLTGVGHWNISLHTQKHLVSTV